MNQKRRSKWILWMCFALFLYGCSGIPLLNPLNLSTSLGDDVTQDAVLGDLDGDGDLDAMLANSGRDSVRPETIWINQGGAQEGLSGSFALAAQTLGNADSTSVALGDLDGDGDLDAFITTQDAASVWLNNGAGRFMDSGQRLGDQGAAGIILADLDGDGDLDALTHSMDQVEIWLNDSSAGFTLSGQRLELPERHVVALGDLDGDGDLDLFAARSDQDYKIWWNDGFGRLGIRWR